MALLFIVGLVFLLPLAFLLFSKWRYTFWKRSGIKQLNPELPYGDFRDLLTKKISDGEANRILYLTFKEMGLRFGGAYFALRPVFVPVDIKIIKDMLLKEFSSFHDRGLYNHEKDILSWHLFRIEGQPWKNLRAKLTPTFTSSRMKMMFETLLEKSSGLEKLANEYVVQGGQIQVKEVAARYTTDVIGTCAFGIECDTMSNPDSEFRYYGSQINVSRAYNAFVENTFPASLLAYSGYKSFGHVEPFFKKLVTETIEHREKNNIFRKDLMHLLIQLRNKGTLTEDGNITKDETKKGLITDDEIVSQCFLFFGAGFDTSSAAMGVALYELSKQPDIQKKVRKEIREILEKHDGKLTYDALKELAYLEKVILETLRMYPTAPTAPRIATKDYKIPGTDVVLKKGTAIRISIWAIHMDPEYYPDPEHFDPERFNEENKSKRPDFTYLPFGEGPRMCIGSRFAMMQMKVGLVSLLKDFHYSVGEKTPKKLTFVPAQFLLHCESDLWLDIERVA